MSVIHSLIPSPNRSRLCKARAAWVTKRYVEGGCYTLDNEMRMRHNFYVYVCNTVFLQDYFCWFLFSEIKTMIHLVTLCTPRGTVVLER